MEASSRRLELARKGISTEGWVPVASPGIEWYAAEIRDGAPFSMCRYGEGEWRVICPDMHLKQQRVFSEWHSDEAQDDLRATLLNCHDHERYWPCIWHQRYFAKDGRLAKVTGWLEENGLEDINWHDGRVWRRATENDRVHVITSAIRDQTLPFVVVGPDRIREAMGNNFNVAKFIAIHPHHAYYDRDEIVRKVLKFGKPALISFSAGGTSNILIHTLFPEIGEQSFMIDFGAMWEGLAGRKTRPYHKSLTIGRIKKAWGK